MNASGQKAVDLMMESLSSCGSHTLAFSALDVSGVVGAFYTDNGGDDELGSEENGAGLVTLRDGRWGVVTDSSDYTGHG